MRAAPCRRRLGRQADRPWPSLTRFWLGDRAPLPGFFQRVAAAIAGTERVLPRTDRLCWSSARAGISLRTVYRDIASLKSQCASIDGAPGLGYLLKPGFTLPPLMFTTDEVEALVLGSRWVMDRGDARLAAAARDALAKIAAVLVAWCELRQSIRHFRTDRITRLALSGSRAVARP